jgi:hypothetical protein
MVRHLHPLWSSKEGDPGEARMVMADLGRSMTRQEMWFLAFLTLFAVGFNSG